MDQKTMVKQAFEFQKSTWDSMYQSMVTLQDQAEKSVGLFLDRVPWMPEESKKIVLEWGHMYKKGREDLKRVVDDGYDKMESYLVSTAEATERAAGQAARQAAQHASRAASETKKASGKTAGK